MAFKLNLGVLQVVIGADTAPLDRAEKKVLNTNKRMGRSFRKLGGLIAGAISFEAARRTLLIADNMNLLDAKIKAVTTSAKQFEVVRKGVRDIARETGNSIQSVGTLAQSLLIAVESMDATDDQIVSMIGNLNKLGSIGGSSADQMGNAMLQFGQAMAGGIVRAEEFNSIVENTPLIAKSIADGLGLSIGELRKMVIEGKLLSEDVFEALKGQTDEINKKFAEMPLTINRASGQIAAAFAIAVQEIDKGFGATSAIAEMMSSLANIIESDLVPAFDSVILEMGEILDLWGSVTEDARESVDETLNWAESLKLIKDAISFIGTAIKELPANLRDVFTILFGEGEQLFLKMKAVAILAFSELSTTLRNTLETAITAAQTAFFDFIANIRGKFAEIFDFFGADKIAESLRGLAEESKATSAELTADTQENIRLRNEALESELQEVIKVTEAKVKASQSAIESGLSETEALKREVAKRRDLRKKELQDNRNKTKETEKAIKKIAVADKKGSGDRVKNLQAANSTVNSLEQAGIVSSRAAGAAQIGIAAGTAIAKTSELGFPQALPFIAQALATIAQARSLNQGGRQFGGTVSAGKMARVGEGGDPELFLDNAGGQFLIPGRGGKVMSGRDMAVGGGGGISVTVINETPIQVTPDVEFVTSDQLNIRLRESEENTVGRINTSLSTGRGETSGALRTGFATSRNI